MKAMYYSKLIAMLEIKVNIKIEEKEKNFLALAKKLDDTNEIVIVKKAKTFDTEYSLLDINSQGNAKRKVLIYQKTQLSNQYSQLRKQFYPIRDKRDNLMLKRVHEKPNNPTDDIIKNDTKRQLMKNSDQLNKQDKQIAMISKTAIQTVVTTNETLINLKGQRDKINIAIQDTKDSKANVYKSKGIIERMDCREFFYRSSLYILIFLLFLSTLALLVYKFSQ